MHTVVEMPEFLRAAARAGVSEEDRKLIVDAVATDPSGGVPLGGGLYKRRIAGRGKGKSGGYRVMTVFVGEALPVLLIGLISKGNTDNFSKPEIAAMTAAARIERS
ncbi:type II toxin-antitoxin system RelE/ParE family toxin [Sphingosinicellaceae bacterium]|nr:type II toxin-antitoxin system RelE/ParE family toxin [Sphingosinicellaceae bacterium]